MSSPLEIGGVARQQLLRVLGLTAASGAAIGLMIPLVNWSTLRQSPLGSRPLLVGLYAAGLVLMYVLYRYSAGRIAGIFEERLATLRVEVAETLSRAELRTVERRAEIQTKLTSDIDRISRLSETLVYALQAAFLFLSSTIYILILSLSGFVVWCLTFVLIAVILRPVFRARRALTERAGGDEAAYAALTTQYIRGIKQLKLDGRAAAAMVDEIHEVGTSLHRARGELEHMATDAIVKGTDIFWIGIGVLLLWSTGSRGADSSVMYQLVTVFFLTVSPVIALIRDGHALLDAYAAYQSLLVLEEELRQSADTPALGGAAEFQRLAMRQVIFRYDAGPERDWRIGPVDLVIERGELVFITGGNGSGKSTLMKLLAGLYAPASGAVLVDDRPVEDGGRGHYRALFTALFAEHYLFEKPYGCAADPAAVRALLTQLGLDQVTDFQDGRFTTLALSTGQSKRLAMAVALLEDRPVYIFDEWDAHQDPQRRAFYYRTLLPELKRRGKTVIAVSHDERYFHLADHLIRMHKGSIQIDTRSNAPA